MKKIAIIAAMLAIAASCTVNEMETATVQAPSMYGITEGDSATKTVITVDDEGVGTIWWKPADQINVFFGSLSVPYTSANTEDATTVLFNTTAMIGSTESASDNKWGLYPYDAEATCDGSSVTTTVPAAQECVAETFADDLFPMIAHTSTNELRFKNVCGGIKFSLSRDDIKSITFKGNDDEDIAGKVEISMDSDGDPVAEVVAGEKAITLTPKSGSTFAKNTNYYIVMLPVVLENGFTMTFETEGAIGTFEYTTKAVEIKRSVFGKKENIDTYATFIEDNMYNGHEFVDLGMPSGTFWATMNVGAESPEMTGLTYGWGEITSGFRTTSNCATYGKNGYELTQGGYINESYILTSMYDIANIKWGENWRMPTYSEFYELIDNCTWTWISAGEDNGFGGVAGYKVQSNIQGYSDRFIFFPEDPDYYGNTILGNGGPVCMYWSASCVSYGSEFSYCLHLKENSFIVNKKERYWDFCVRPVVTGYLSDQTPSISSPNVGAIRVVDVGASTAILESALEDTGNGITEYGFYYGSSPDAMDRKITISGNTKSACEISYRFTGLTNSTTYYVKTYARNKAGETFSDVVSFTTSGYTGKLDGHDWVDLGIRKSHIDSSIVPDSEDDKRIVFATTNVGAKSATNPGYYFRWGDLMGWIIEFEPVHYSSEDVWNDSYEQWHWYYRWITTSTTQYDKNGSVVAASTSLGSNPLSSDSVVDFQGLTDLNVGGVVYGDAASYNWGGSWMMPNSDLLQLLRDACSGYQNGNANNGPTLTFNNKQAGYCTINNSSIKTSITIPYTGSCSFSSFSCNGSDGCFEDIYTGEVSTTFWITDIMCSTPISGNKCLNLTCSYSSGISVNQISRNIAGSVRPVAELTL